MPKQRKHKHSKFIKPLVRAKSRNVKDKLVFLYPILLIVSISILLIAAIIIFVSKKLPPQVPLYYGLPRGEKQLASPLTLILPISLASLFITLNAIIAYFTKSAFLKKVLILGAFFTSLLAIITVVKIIFLVI